MTLLLQTQFMVDFAVESIDKSMCITPSTIFDAYRNLSVFVNKFSSLARLSHSNPL